MKPTLYIFDEDVQALHDLCVACMGRGCTNCLPDRLWLPLATWELALAHEERTPPLDPDRIYARDRQPVPMGGFVAGNCDSIHPPRWVIGAEPVLDREEEAAEVLRIIAAAREGTDG